MSETYSLSAKRIPGKDGIFFVFKFKEKEYPYPT